MRHRFYCLVLLGSLTVFWGQVNSQSNQRISGKITDEKTGFALPGANILIDGTTLGTTAASDGVYRLPALPKGKYTLTVTHIGYSAKSIQVTLAENGRSVDVRLSRRILSGPVVTIVATEARARVSPVAFAAIEKQELDARYAFEDIPEILSELPSTTFYSEGGHGLGYNYLSIRGFDQRRISVLINGVPQNDPEDHNVYWIDFPDFAANIQSVQVQRGAGSAFYGPAAIGGSINIQTNYFSPEAGAKVYFGRGAYGTDKRSIALNSGLLKDKFILFGRASQLKTDGYRERAWVDFKSWFLGAAIYNARSNLRLHFYGGPIKDGLAYIGVPKDFNADGEKRRTNFLGPDEIENFNQPHFEALYEWEITPSWTLNSSLFFIRGYGFFDFDGSWGTPEYFRLTPEHGFDPQAIPADALIRAYVDNRQFGWLPQLKRKFARGEIILGAELRRHRSLHWGRLQRGAGLAAEIAGDGARRYYEYRGGKNILSFYLHTNFQVRRGFFVMADVQYAFKKYRIFDEAFVGTEFSKPYHFLNPRFGVNYNLNRKLNLFANISHTTREPRLKNLYDAAEASTPVSWGAVLPQFDLDAGGAFDYSRPLVKPENLLDFELGAGYRAGRFHGGINLYVMDFRDEIIKKGGIDRFGQPITGNAERTIHQGIEINGEFQLLPRLQVSGNLLTSVNELKSYTVFDDADTPIVLDGNRIAGFPNTLGNFRVTYAWNDFHFSTLVKYIGKFYTDNFQDETNTVDPYAILNFSARLNLGGVGLRGVQIQAQIRNLLNKKYLSHGEGGDFFPGAERHAFLALQYAL